jgi:hypothetical protein
VTFFVGGEEFEVSKPFLMLHSPVLKRSFEQDPKLARIELPGEARSFRAFVKFVQGAEGADGEVTADNMADLLHWAKELNVSYIPALCEEFLLLRPPADMQTSQLLEVAARHDMAFVYTRAVEALANGMTHLEVPENQSPSLQPVFAAPDIREDVLRAHISMGLMRNDAESRRTQRFADYGGLDDKKQRARVVWKSRQRFAPKPAEQREHNWKSLQICWPHHSFRGDDWTAVPAESQPTMPMRNRTVAACGAT